MQIDSSGQGDDRSGKERRNHKADLLSNTRAMQTAGEADKNICDPFCICGNFLRAQSCVVNSVFGYPFHATGSLSNKELCRSSKLSVP
mmetsp:Transcript_21797/g.88775  ORF Transcript_21797/g.88775 Transcript_21797/m.88775 type:complete len:88 (+) Transcript_21797:912-1175(+)